jgi:hypothetical protein
MTIEQIPVADCHYAPFLADVPLERDLAGLLGQEDKAKITELEAAWEGWVQRAEKEGISQPVFFYRENGQIFITDGRNRHTSASAAGLVTIPGVERLKGDAERDALLALGLRKNSTKGATAYFALTLYPHLAAGKPGPKKKPGNEYPNSLAELAPMAGVSTETMKDASDTWRFFQENPEVRERLEGKVLAGLIALGSARRVVGPNTKPGGKRPPSSHTTAIKHGLSLTTALGTYEAWKDGEADLFKLNFSKRLAKVSLNAIKVLMEAVEAAAELKAVQGGNEE